MTDTTVKWRIDAANTAVVRARGGIGLSFLSLAAGLLVLDVVPLATGAYAALVTGAYAALMAGMIGVPFLWVAYALT